MNDPDLNNFLANVPEYKITRVMILHTVKHIEKTSPTLAFYLAKNLDKLRTLESNGYYDECLKILDEFKYIGIDVSPVYYQKFVNLKGTTENGYHVPS